MSSVGILANPLSGRDVRRLAARASTTTPEILRDQVARVAVGAVAAGAKKLLLLREPFGVSVRAVENLELAAEVELLDVGAELCAADTARAALRMREAGCGALVVLGGDGTNRVVASVWPDAPLVPLSTGTNNVFPLRVEATAAGAAAGLVAAGRLALDDVARPTKCVAVEIEGEAPDLALIDAVFLVDDAVGNYMPVEPHKLRRLVLARAEPDAVGMSAIGGLVAPCGDDEEAGVDLECGPGAEAPLLAPISPGLFREVPLRAARRLALGETVRVEGPGVLAFDGDRARTLEPGQGAVLSVRRDGPQRIDVAGALRRAAEIGAFRGVHFHDALDAAHDGRGCC